VLLDLALASPIDMPRGQALADPGTQPVCPMGSLVTASTHERFRCVSLPLSISSNSSALTS